MIDTIELRKLTQAATSGEWYVKRGNYIYGRNEVTDGEEVWYPVIAYTDDDEVNVNFEANAAFIAAANPAAISELLDRLEAAEKETASWKGLAKQFGNEADALRAKIERMEKQEPVAIQHRVPSVDFRGECVGYSELKDGKGLEHWPRRTLYALPGAQTQGEEK